MSENKPYVLERNSRIMSYLPGGESIGGMLDAVELSLDEISDEYFADIKILINKIRAHKFNPEDIGISGDFRWHIEIGPKDTKAQELHTIFGSVAFEIIPSEVMQLHEKLKESIRDAHLNPPPPPKLN